MAGLSIQGIAKPTRTQSFKVLGKNKGGVSSRELAEVLERFLAAGADLAGVTKRDNSRKKCLFIVQSKMLSILRSFDFDYGLHKFGNTRKCCSS